MNEPITTMSPEEHQERHKLLHRMLDELLADWIEQTSCRPGKSTVMELVSWSHQQTIQPTEKGGMR